MTNRTFLVVSFLCTLAVARTPEGSLGPLRTPNDARPAMLMPGGAFDVSTDQTGALTLVTESARHALTPDWSELPSGGFGAQCVLPSEIVPGMYTLEWSSGDEVDATRRSVFVVEAMPQRYSFASIGSSELTGEPNVIARTLKLLADSTAAFAVVFADSDELQLKSALDALHECVKPTYFVAEGSPAAAERWLGPLPYAFRFGPDAFFACDSGRSGLGDVLGAGPSTLAQLRRLHKTARWAVALLPRFDDTMPMRNTITLFVDDPMHAVITGTPIGDEPAPKPIEWAGWFEPTLVYSPRTAAFREFSVSLKNVAPLKTATTTPSKTVPR